MRAQVLKTWTVCVQHAGDIRIAAGGDAVLDRAELESRFEGFDKVTQKLLPALLGRIPLGRGLFKGSGSAGSMDFRARRCQNPPLHE
jgi:hypothetical protein